LAFLGHFVNKLSRGWKATELSIVYVGEEIVKEYAYIGGAGG